MANNWLTVLNIFLLLVILVASLSVPGEDMMDDAMFIGETDDNNNRKILNEILTFLKLDLLFIYSNSRVFQFDGDF